MSDFVDPYIDEETGVLRNLLGAKNLQELREAEGQASIVYALDLDKIPRTNNLDELCAIHRTLFSHIYDWAGKIRTVDIKKGSEDFFLAFPQIETGAKYIFSELEKENFLNNLSIEDFVKRISYYYEQLNFIHPFREGNGRTQRLFWSRVAKDAGFKIDWSKVVGDELDEASFIGRTRQNLEPLEKMFSKIISKN